MALLLSGNLAIFDFGTHLWYKVSKETNKSLKRLMTLAVYVIKPQVKADVALNQYVR